MKKKIGILIALLLVVAVIVCVVLTSGKNEPEQNDEGLELIDSEVTEQPTEEPAGEPTEEPALSGSEATEQPAEEPDLLARIQQKGELVIATEGNWAPWTYHDTETNELVGFDVEVATLIAEKLGVKATFVECPWESIFAGIDAKRYDIAANGVEITDERAEKYDFSTPYGYIRTALVVHKDNTDINSFEDLAGKSTVNSIASTYMTLAESYGATATGVSTLDMTIENVLYKRADATLNAEVSIYDYLSVHPDAAIKIVALTDEASQVSIPVRKGDDSASFLEAVNNAIAELAAEGKLSELSLKYFGSDITSPTTK